MRVYGKKVFLISDCVMEKIGYVRSCEKILEDLNVFYVVYLDVNIEFMDLYVNEVLNLCLRE